MASAAIAGISGAFSLSNGSKVHGGDIRAWSLDLIQEVNDSTGFSDGGYRTCLGGLRSARGSASGYARANGTNDSPNFGSTISTGLSQTGGALTLTAKSGCTYAFSAICSNVRYGTGVDGNATISYDFVSNGAITETYAET